HLTSAMDRLRFFCEQEQSCAVVIGDSGSGKSTLARWLYQSLDLDSHEILLTSMTRQERLSGWLTPRLKTFLSHQAQEPALNQNDHYQLMQQTVAALDEFRRDQRRLIVIIDAAHKAVTPEAFDDIISLLNLESLTGAPGCLAFVLLGLP